MSYKALTSLVTVVAGLAAGFTAAAQDTPWPDRNRIGLGYRMGFNTSVDFRSLGSTPLANNPSVTGRSYDNGFVGTDDTGNAGGLTSYWGYQSAGQVTDGDEFLLMRSSNAGALGTNPEDEPTHGFELSYARELLRYRQVRLGIEAAFNAASFSVDQQTTPAAAMLVVDAFPLGYSPPEAPFTGTPNAGPFAPLLGTTPAGLPVTVGSRFEAFLSGIHLGPYVDVPLGKWVQLTLSGGLALTRVDAEYRYTETCVAPDGTIATSGAQDSDTSWEVGGYAGLIGWLRLQDQVSLFTGVQYRTSGSLTLTAGDRQAGLDLGSGVYWTLGLGLSF